MAQAVEVRAPHLSVVTADPVPIGQGLQEISHQQLAFHMRAHVRSLGAYATMLLGTSDEADDLVQETLLRAIEYTSSYRPGTNLRAWLFTIMRSRFYNNCRKSSRERTGQSECVSALPSGQATQEWHLRQKELVAAISRLPRHYREALILISVLGESYIQAAEILECDIGTIKSRVSRARRILRNDLGPEV